jgi:hypothetical protein
MNTVAAPMSEAGLRYRPTVRAAALASTALALRVAVLLLVSSGTVSIGRLWTIVPIVDVVATLIGVAAIGYAAIAAHRGPWSALLIAAWIEALLAIVVHVNLFFFAIT